MRCHGPDKNRGDLKLHTRELMLQGGEEDGPGIVVGQPDKSPLIQRVKLPHGDEDIMPAKGDPLTTKEIDILVRWVESGASWPEGVVLEKKERQDKAGQTVVADGLEPAHKKVDEVLALENVDRKNLQPGPALDDMAYLRKLTVDMIGRIPTLEEVSTYRSWPATERRARLVESLFEHERFADRWTVFFSDMLRIRTGAPGGDQLLAYVHHSIREGKAYDKLANELIALNGRPTDNPAAAFALGDDADPMELTASTSQIFLGVRLMCAQCHNHPFDEWDQKQFYQMAGFFGKTKKIETDIGRRRVYTTEGKEMQVLWPPEREKPPSRSPISPKFPFSLEQYTVTPPHIARLEKRRGKEAHEKLENVSASIDDLLDGADATVKTDRKAPAGFDVMRDLKDQKSKVDIKGDLYRQSELRQELADLVTSPRNRYFSRAFVNRIWAELMGRGFFEPIDNFTDISQVSHPKTIDLLADEFVASGYDLRSLIRAIVFSDAYQRGQNDASIPEDIRTASKDAFVAGRPRRMLSEVLYDSVVKAGHLFDYKWPKGANIKTIEKLIRVPVNDDGTRQAPPAEPQPTADTADTNLATMQSMQGIAGGDPGKRGGYSLEESIGLDFDKLLDGGTEDETESELAQMKMMNDRKVEREQRMREAMERNRRRQKYTYATVKETLDDNPKFSTSMRMATPAAPEHFLRVFGQPSRASLGEFRDHNPSMRQALMMLNGKITHEAARVGPSERIYKLLEKDVTDAKRQQAIKVAYLESLTRMPDADELSMATEVIQSADSDLEGMADLRWALLNCHEFRYLP